MEEYNNEKSTNRVTAISLWTSTSGDTEWRRRQKQSSTIQISTPGGTHLYNAKTTTTSEKKGALFVWSKMFTTSQESEGTLETVTFVNKLKLLVKSNLQNK